MDCTASRNSWLVSLVAIFVAVVVSPTSAQVATGTPPLSSIAGGPFDTVNLGNLNVHFAIPVVHKAGRGTDFTYDISYDNSVWTPTTFTGTNQWQPVFNWGWRGQTEAAVGYVSSWEVDTDCWYTVGRVQYQGYEHMRVSNYVYHDAWGVPHPFNGASNVWTGTGGGNCTLGTNNTVTSVAGDGSGYTLYANLQSGTITTKAGKVTTPPFSSGSGPATSKDANGNEITVNSSGQFFDTLSSSAPVLTVPSTVPPSATAFTYTSPAGPESYTMNYKQYTVATNFGLSGISEYPATAVYLVDNITLPDGSKYTFAYEPTPTVPAAGKCTPIGSTTCVTARIAQVTLNTGGTIIYSYSGGSNGIQSDGSTATLTRQLSPGGIWTYSRSNVSGSEWQTTVSDPTYPTPNQTVIDFQEDSTTTNFFETERLVYQGSATGTPLSTTITCYNGNSIATPATCPSTAVASPILRTSVFKYLPNAAGQQAETDTTFDQFGLTHEVDDYDFGSAAVGPLIRKTITAYATLGNNIVDRPSSVTIADVNNHTWAYTSYSYDGTTPTATSGTPQHVSVSGSRGLLTTVAAEANGTTTLYRQYSYYDTGTLSTSTDVSTSSSDTCTSKPASCTTYNYAPGPASCGNSFVTSIAEPQSLSGSMTWDCNGGVMLSLTDENGNTSSTAYSGSSYTNYFWRPYSTKDQAGFETDYSYYLNSQSQPFQTKQQTVTFNGGSSIIDVQNTYDGFGRIIFSQTKQAPTGTNFDTVATCYDSSGRVSLTTLAYTNVVINSGTATCPSGNAGTTYGYDALNRTTGIAATGGQGLTSYQYNENDVLQSVSSPGKSKQLEYDSLDRLKSVCEVTSGSTGWPGASCAQNTSATGYLTSYLYDPLGDLVSVTQNAQASSNKQTRSYTFDMLGRMINETNPETNNATSNTYSYDSLTNDASCGSPNFAGNLLKRTDAAGTVTCYSAYDALHRLGAITYPASGIVQKFVYDAATVNGSTMTNAKTRLAEASTCTGTCSSKITDLGFSYSATGLTTDVWENTPHSGGYYHTTAGYFPNGSVSSLAGVPGVSGIAYLVDGEGRPNTAAFGITSVVSGVSYNAASQPLFIYNMSNATASSSGDNDAYTYEPNTGRMTSYKFTVASASETGNLTWNTNGTLSQLAITDGFNSGGTQTCNYGHDDLMRINSTSCGSPWSQTFSYDPFGNISKSGSISWQPTYTNTINQYQSGWSGVSYDANGNLKYDTFNTYTWNPDRTLATTNPGSAAATCGATGSCLTYDALAREVEVNTNGSYSETLYSPIGKLALMNGRTATKVMYPMPGGGTLISSSTNWPHYQHPDWLGTARLQTEFASSGLGQGPDVVDYDRSFAPFGEEYNNFGSDAYNLNFTGDIRTMGSSGLFDTENRELHSNQGRWISPDPAGIAAVDPSNPQTWNRYAYVANNPLSNLDPSGLDCVYIDDEGAGVEAIDHGPCDGGSGGYYIPGTVDPSSISVNSDNGTITAVSSAWGGSISTAGAEGSNPYGAYTDTFATGLNSLTNFASAANNSDTHPGLAAFYNNPRCPHCGDTLRSANTVGKMAFVATGIVIVAVPLIGEAAAAIAACEPGLNTSNYGHVTVYCSAWMPGQLIGIGYDPQNGLHVNVGNSVHIPLWPWK